ncbi:MAG: hypothetical protein RR500_08135, partial [Bacilli bacterium]
MYAQLDAYRHMGGSVIISNPAINGSPFSEAFGHIVKKIKNYKMTIDVCVKKYFLNNQKWREPKI